LNKISISKPKDRFYPSQPPNQIFKELKKYVNLYIIRQQNHMFLANIKTAALKFTSTLVLFFFFTSPFQKAFTQLAASFSISRESGCRPLTVKFVNTTTGAGQDVTYSWNFGNGNTSTLKDPGATFIEEKTYTVTLTVTSGGSTSTATRQVTVHKTPTVDFLATPTSGCMPLEVSFQANVTPGDGTIDRYFWDFGDGKTEEAPTLSAPEHTYTQAQQAPVSLTVTNSFGCFNTKSSPGLIQVHPLPEADFTWAKNPLCGNNEPIPFQNKSLLQSGTTWLWDFGDGNKSTQKDPVHKYASEGTFKVSLVAKSNQGCTDSIHYFISNAIEMILPTVVCEGDTIELKHNVPRPFLFENWYVNGMRIAADFQGKHFYKVNKPDALQIRLDIETNNCTASKEATIAVNPAVTKNHIQKIRLNPCDLTPEFEISDQSGFGASWIWSKDNLSNVIGNEKLVKVGFDIEHEMAIFN
jgi:PKD repeat protein